MLESSSPLPTREFRRELGRWLILLLPWSYASLLLACAVHEVLGHGLAAELTGGDFVGFELHLDGYGRARHGGAVDLDWVLAAGGIANVVGSVACLVAAHIWRGVIVRAALIVLAIHLCHDGLPYAYWGALVPGERGDVSRLLAKHADPALRAWTVTACGVLYVVLDFATLRALFRTLEESLGPLSSARAWTVASLLFAAATAGYFAFDWSQLIEGVSQSPAWLGLALHAAFSIWLVRSRRERVVRREVAPGAWMRAWIGSWSAAAASVAVVGAWLGDGLP